jgi:SAM-dependent methyltransferase
LAITTSSTTDENESGGARKRLRRIVAQAFQASEPLEPQTLHRIDLVDFWGVTEGMRVLEVGCGPGDATAVLAAAVGPKGRVLGVEKAPSSVIWDLTGLPATLTQKDMPVSAAVEEYLAAHVYGGSPALGSPLPRLLESELGGWTSLRLGLDLLDEDVDFPPDSFDMVVFSHCSWYFEQPETLAGLFRRTRRWAKSLAYAEWDLLPRGYEQVPHLLAALLQLNVLALCPSARQRNVVSLILPQDARRMAEQGGWRLARERDFDTSSLQDAVWEGRVAHELAAFSARMTPYARGVIEGQQRLLAELERRIGGATSRDPGSRAGLIKENRIKTLNAYAFLAERADG